MATVFIDGAAGTTGLRIRERLAGRRDITLIELDEERRKDPSARRDALNRSDAAILCLPDAAAVEAVSLLDPGNLYQISYYEAVELSEAPGGFVRVRCQTPDVDQILNRYESARETMMLDMSTLRLADGASLVSDGQNRMDLEVGGELGMHYKKDFKIGGKDSQAKFSVEADIGSSWTGKVKVGLFVQNSVEIEETDKIAFSGAFGAGDKSDPESFEDAMENTVNWYKQNSERLYKATKTL